MRDPCLLMLLLLLGGRAAQLARGSTSCAVDAPLLLLPLALLCSMLLPSLVGVARAPAGTGSRP